MNDHLMPWIFISVISLFTFCVLIFLLYKVESMRKKKKALERICPSDLNEDAAEKQRELQRKTDEKSFWTTKENNKAADSIKATVSTVSSAKRAEEELLGLGPLPRDVAREIDEEQARRREIEPEVRF